MNKYAWGIKLSTNARQALKRLADEDYNYSNADCIYDDVRVLDREIGVILKEGVICKSYVKEMDKEEN